MLEITPKVNIEGIEFYPSVDGLSEDVKASLAVGIAGRDGKDGINGKDGYTPVKGKDYFDGKDGYTPVKGKDYYDGIDGYTPIKGEDYFDGKDGLTPVKGKDYFTEADKNELADDILSKIEIPGGDMEKAVYDADDDGIVDNAKEANHALTAGEAELAIKANGLTSTVLSASSSKTPSSTGATDVHSLNLTKGVWIYIISVTWSKINTATKVMVRNSQRKVPSKCYGYFPVSNITPGIQSVDIIALTADTTVYSQIWPEDSASLKEYSVQTHAIKIA